MKKTGKRILSILVLVCMVVCQLQDHTYFYAESVTEGQEIVQPESAEEVATAAEEPAAPADAPVVAALAPVVETEAPVAVPEPQVVETEPPVAATEPSVVETEAPVAATEPQGVEAEPPVAATEPQVVETEPPVAATEPQVVETEPPVVAIEPQVVETEPPVTETEVPIVADTSETEEKTSETAAELQTDKPDEVLSEEATESESEVETETESEEETEEVTEEVTEELTEIETEEEEVPFSASAVVDGVTVKVSAGKGVFPQGCKLSVRKVSASQENRVEQAVEAECEEGKNIAVSYTFDIKVLDKNGKEIEPNTDKGEVRVSFSHSMVRNENLTAEVYHVEQSSGGALQAEALDAVTYTSSQTVAAETDGFSYYMLAFTYGNLEYVLRSGSTTPLSTILTAVGLSADNVTSVVSSANSYIHPNYSSGVWSIRVDDTPSMDPQTLTVTIDGAVYVIHIKLSSHLYVSMSAPTQVSSGGEYSSYIRLSSEGINTNLRIQNTYGKYLSFKTNSAGLYTDENCTIPYTGSFTNDSNGFPTVINEMTDGETIYLKFSIILYVDEIEGNYGSSQADRTVTANVSFTASDGTEFSNTVSKFISYSDFGFHMSGKDNGDGMITWYVFVNTSSVTYNLASLKLSEFVAHPEWQRIVEGSLHIYRYDGSGDKKALASYGYTDMQSSLGGTLTLYNTKQTAANGGKVGFEYLFSAHDDYNGYLFQFKTNVDAAVGKATLSTSMSSGKQVASGQYSVALQNSNNWTISMVCANTDNSTEEATWKVTIDMPTAGNNVSFDDLVPDFMSYMAESAQLDIQDSKLYEDGELPEVSEEIRNGGAGSTSDWNLSIFLNRDGFVPAGKYVILFKTKGVYEVGLAWNFTNKVDLHNDVYPSGVQTKDGWRVTAVYNYVPNRWNICYNSGVSKAGTGSPQVSQYNLDPDEAAPLIDNWYTLPGYTFVGWRFSMGYEYSEKVYQPGEKVTPSDFGLYAESMVKGGYGNAWALWKPVDNPIIAKELVYDGTSQNLIDEITANYYCYSVTSWIWRSFSVNDGPWTTDIPTALDAGTYTIKYSIGGIHIVATSGEVTAVIKPAELTVTTGSNSGTYNGTALTNSDASLEGLVDGETATIKATGSQTNAGSSDNTYEIEWGTAKESNYTVKTENLGKLTVAKANTTLQNAPAAIDGLECNGSPHVLVSYDGTQTLEYSLDGENWSSDLPTGTDEGDYTVYYRVQEDENHNASTSASITATIKKAVGPTINSVSGADLTYGYTTGSISVSATPLEGSTITGYQWYSNTTNSNEGGTIIDGATESSYTIPTGKDVGTYYYYCVVSATDTETENIATSTSGAAAVTVGKLAVTVTITGHSNTTDYDGSEHSVSGYDFSASSTLYKQTDFSFAGSAEAKQTDAGTTSMGIKGEDFSNINENFGPVTFNVTDGYQTIEPKTVVISWSNTELTYNGSEQQPTAAISNLIDGTTCNITVTGGQTNAGETYTATATALSNANYKLPVENTDDYNESGSVTFTIKPAPLTVTTGSNSAPYDGTVLTKAEASIEGLVNGETAEIVATGKQTEVGSSSNAYSITWGTAKAENYTVAKKNLGTLNVAANNTEITLTAPSDSKPYDGTPLTKTSGVTASGLPAGFTVTATASGSQTNVGSSDNVVNDDYVIKNASNQDRTSSFTNVKTAAGTLTVTKSDAVIQDAPIAKEGLTYSGEEQTLIEAPVSQNFEYSNDGENWTTDLPAATDAGDYTVYYRVSADENHNPSEKDQLTATIAKLGVTVTITGHSNSTEYDGEEHSVSGYDFSASTAIYSQADSRFCGSAEAEQTNAGTMSMGIKEDDFANINENFGPVTFNVTDGYQTIEPAPLTVTTGSASAVYDGTALTNAEASIEGLLYSETATIIATGSQTEVGSSDNTYAIEWETALSTNYIVKTENLGMLTISANSTEITLTAPSDSKTYDGTPLTKTDGVMASGLPDGFTVEATATGSQTIAGSSDNVVNGDYVIKNASNEDRTSSFTNVKTVAGTLTIIKSDAVIQDAPKSEIVYTCEQGDVVEYHKNSGDLLITMHRSVEDEKTFGLYKYTEIDGNQITEKQAAAGEGSLKLKLYGSYLNSLTNGNHKLTAYFEDGEKSVTLKVVSEEKVKSSTDNSGNSSENADTNTGNRSNGATDGNPKTGDDSNAALWLLMMLLGLAVILGTSAGIYRTRYRR